VAVIGALIFCAAAAGQGARPDYQRANALRAKTEGKVFKSRVAPHWFAGNARFWYRNDLAGGEREFVLVDAERGTRQPAFDHARLAAALAKATGKPADARRLPIEQLVFDDQEPAVLLQAAGKAWRCDLRSYELQPEKDGAKLAPESLPKRAGLTASRRTGPETSITFVNRTKGDFDLFWLDTDGQRKAYGTVRAGQERRQHTFAGHVWLVADRAGKTLAVFEAAEEPGTAIVDGSQSNDPPAAEKPRRRKDAPAVGPGPASPDGRWRAFFKDHNLHLRDVKTGQEHPLSTDGAAEDAYGGQVWWSPDSQKLAVLRTSKGDDRKVYYVESSPKDQLQPKLHSYDYLKPGDRIPLARPRLFDVAGRRPIAVSDEMFPNPWSVTALRWQRDARRFLFLYNQRGHQALRLIALDAATGRAEAIIDERSETFIDYSGKQFIQFLDETGEVLWMSERDGWNHLYLYDAATGRVKNQVTKGAWVVRRVERVDEQKRQVWFRAGGIRPGQDPYFVHFCRVNFDGTGLAVLTAGDGSHAIEFSPDGRFFVDTWSRVDLPPQTELRRSDDGRLVCALEQADWSQLLETGWQPPERFVAKGRDGATDIYGVIFRPTHFDPKKKYPIIEEIYAGPQGAFVPKTFHAFHGPQTLAELGFIVVKIDGMGTAHRSKRFHDVCWKNLGDSGLPDRILWIKAAAAKYPYMDTGRVGIYGGSAGGQSAVRALLAHGDFYKVAVADCGCHDNRMDKIWWNEQWMGWPVGPHYAEQSNVTQAHRLQGKLMLFVGEMDENVDPASTMQLANALIRADKDFDLVVMTGRGHGSAESPYGIRRRQDFFVRHLLDIEPRP
jgi:dipeptidyl aminopeptidase/acylaminoacyl peptidase